MINMDVYCPFCSSFALAGDYFQCLWGGHTRTTITASSSVQFSSVQFGSVQFSSIQA